MDSDCKKINAKRNFDYRLLAEISRKSKHLILWISERLTSLKLKTKFWFF